MEHVCDIPAKLDRMRACVPSIDAKIEISVYMVPVHPSRLALLFHTRCTITGPGISCSYTTSLTEVFSRQHKLELEWRVELALLKALGEVGKIPVEAHDEIKKVVDSGAVTLARTLEIEKSTHHDIMAMVKAIAEQSPTYGGFVHFGATSQDVNDTVLALQMGECKVRRDARRA